MGNNGNFTTCLYVVSPYTNVKKVDDLAKKQTHQNNYLLKPLDFAKLFCTLSLGNNGYL